MPRLLHSSDLHVRDEEAGWPRAHPLAGIGGLAAVLRAACVQAADLVLLAGDVFDNHRISDAVLARAAALIAASPVPVVLLPGNHDAALPHCLFRRAGLLGLPHVDVLGVTREGGVEFPRLGLEVSGVAHRGEDFAPLAAPPPRRARWHVLAAHGHYVPPPEWRHEAHRSWLISAAELAACDADYVALGHWDRRAQVGEVAWYSGSPDLAGTANLVTLDEAGVAVSPVPLAVG